MFGDIRDQNDTWVKSYSYLRTAMACLLIGLGVAVFYQTWQQGFHLLSSVSAYYYTPAQAVFVGALIALAACMIALRGTTPVEEVFLNLAGMFAAVVAIVPTSRGVDYRTATRACREAAGPLITGQASPGLDCPTVQALAEATRANVENNMTALLFVGMLGFLAAVFFARREKPRPRLETKQPMMAWWGFGLTSVIFVAGAVAFLASTDWFIDRAHYIAAFGFFVCIVVVAGVNARRHQEKPAVPPGGWRLRQVPQSLTRYRYTWIALVMVVVAVGGAALLYVNWITLFWLEIVVALLFAVFWVVQTIEQMPRPESPSDTSALAPTLVGSPGPR